MSHLPQQQQQDAQSVSQPLGLRRNNSFNSTTTTSSTISASAATATASSTNAVPTKPYCQLGSLAIPINSQKSSPLHIAFHQYLLAPTSDGRLLIYQVCDFDHAENFILEEELSSLSFTSATKPSAIQSLSSQIYHEKCNQTPLMALGPLRVGEYKNIPIGSSESMASSMRDNPVASIVGLTSISVVESTVPSLIGYSALVTLQGDVFVFEFQKSVEEGSLQIQLLCGFGCGRLSAQCIALRYHPITMKLMLACGFLDGTIQEFEVEKDRKSLLWEGYLKQLPITCLAYITNIQTEENRIEEGQHCVEQLVVGMSECEPQPTGQSTPEDIIATCLEVISLNVAKSIWDQKLNETTSISFAPVSLVESTVWPTNEWNNITNIQNRHLHPLERSGSKKVSHELHSIHSIIVSPSSFTVAMSNGAVATLNFWVNDKGKFCWGMFARTNQIILSSPSCNLGALRNYTATCSRDGTIIILPNQTENKLERIKSPISLSFPFESIGFDEDDLVRYVQGFCAGMIRAKVWGSTREIETKSKQLPVFFVSWPGGSIECYSFEYQSRVTPEEEKAVIIRQLFDDGILHELFSLFQSYLKHPTYDGDSQLGRAAREYEQWEGDDDELILSLIDHRMDGSSCILQLLFDQIRGI